MSQVKISQLPIVSVINANTQNTIFAAVDVPSDTTGRITAHTLAQGLYSNEILNVGANPVTLSNTSAQFSGSDPQFLQINNQNFNSTGSVDYIATADLGTQLGGFIDLGINNSQWNAVAQLQTSQFPYDGYLIVDGPGTGPQGNLVIGTANPSTNVVFAVGGYQANNIVAKMTATGLSLNTQSYLTFGDGSLQGTAAASLAYTQAAFAQANTANAMNWIQVGVDATQNTNIGLAWNTANTALQNTANIVIPGNVTISGTSTFNGNMVRNGNLTSTGSVTFNGTFTNNGTTYNNGITYLNGQLLPNTAGISIGSANAPFQNIYTSNSTVLFANSNVAVSGTFTANGPVVLNGTTSVTGSLSTTGAVIISGNTSMMGTLTMNAVNFPTNTSAIQITAAGGNAFQAPANTDYMFQVTGRDGYSTRIIYDSFGTGVYSLVAGRSGRGTAASPTATQAGDVIVRYSGSAYGASANGFSGAGVGRMDLVALDNMTSTTNGTQWNMWTMPVGGNTFVNIASFNSANVTFSNNLIVAGSTTSNTFVYGSSAAAPVVTQLTSRTTSVTANGTSGTIIGYSGSALQHQTGYVFTVNNSSVLHANDTIFVSVQNTNCPLMMVSVANTRVGSFDVSVYNAAGAGNDASYTANINFGIIRVGN
jgi:hypothetical protein